MSLVLQGLLGGIIAVLGAVLWKLSPYLLAQFRSSLLNLPGPTSPSWFFGSLKDIFDSDGEIIIDKWIEEYGPNVLHRGIFNVRCSLYCCAWV